ncbi:MAG TPA: methionyl-tRNA formyltransferase [Candidatus Saccharimonadales bacterium]|nr:methionyl-tRNA formyltransferase [Candidatus Saccharimonadales bacterium]
MKPRIVFFGTGPVSLACLEGIYDVFDVEAIITKPSRMAPSGREHAHPVRDWAKEHSIPIHQVTGKSALQELVAGAKFSAKVGLVVDFGMIIPAAVIDSFPRGIINSHFSLLPLLRGADPITFAILEGHDYTGVSLMRIVPALDEGELIAQERYRLPADTTTPALTRELGDISNQLLREYLPKYITGDINPWPQPVDTQRPTYTRKLTKRDGTVDWHKPAVQLEREVRAFIGWPGSRTQLFGREITLTTARVADGSGLDTDGRAALSSAKPGEPIRSWPDRLLVATGEEALEILQLKPAGKREMAVADFLRGLPTP